jgi:hypothetical protein
VLISFFIYNLTYWTTQAAADEDMQPWPVQLVNNLGEGLQSSGFARTASAVGTLPPKFYKLANLTGLLMQNPNLEDRFVAYPGLTSLWYRDDMQSLVTDATITNALEARESLGEIVKAPSVQAFLANKQLVSSVEETLETNLDDLTTYLNTGTSAKYANEPILGGWDFNVGVSLAWLRQEQPKMAASEMRAIRGLWSQAYAQTTVLLTGDNQVFVKNFPKFVTVAQPNQPLFQPEDWKGDWSRDGDTYTLHVSLNGTDKYLIGNTDGLRLKLKDGRNLLIFDHTD